MQIDRLHLYEEGIKKYLIKAIDVKSRVAFSQANKSISSANAKDFLVKIKRVSPFEVKHIQTDNVSEF